MGIDDDHRTFNDGGEGIDKLKESLKLLDIGEVIGKAKMHAAEAYSHAKEAYSLRDEFFKLIEQHAYANLDSGTKERLSLAAASLNAALGVADAAVATANIAAARAAAADSAQGNYNLLAAKETYISRAYESSVLKDEKATNKDLISEDALKAVSVTDVVSKKAMDDLASLALKEEVATDASQKAKEKPAVVETELESARLDSKEWRLSDVDASEEEKTRLEEECKKKKLEEEEEGKMALKEEVATDASQAKEKPAVVETELESAGLDSKEWLLSDVDASEVTAANVDTFETAASTNLDEKTRLEEECKKKKLEEEEEGKMRDNQRNQKNKKDLLPDEEKKAKTDAALEEGVAVDVAADIAAIASDSGQGIPSSLVAQTASFFEQLTQTLSPAEKRARRREALARGKQDLLREEEKTRLEAECKKKKLEEEEEGKMRDNQRNQKNKKDLLPDEEKKAKTDAALEEGVAVDVAADIAAIASDSGQGIPSSLVAKTDAALEEGVAVDVAADIAAIASDSGQGIPSSLVAQTASFFEQLTQTLSPAEKRARRREALARGKQDLLREEERIRLEAEEKAEKEGKKKKRQEEKQMRDDKRKQKMDKNTKKPKDKDKNKK